MFGDRVDVGHLGGELKDGQVSSLGAGRWVCLEYSFPRREEETWAWHAPSFFSGFCLNVTSSERPPLSILSEMILICSVRITVGW